MGERRGKELERLGEGGALLARMIDAAGVGVALLDADMRFSYASATLAWIVRARGAQSCIGRTPDDVLGAAGASLCAAARRVLSAGARERFELPLRSGDDRTLVVELSPIEGHGGARAVGVLARVAPRDEGADARLAFLLEGSDILARSLEYEITLPRLAELFVTHVADACVIEVLGAHGAPTRVFSAYAEGCAADDARWARFDAAAAEAAHAPAGLDEERARAIASAAGARSVLFVPIAAADRMLGALLLLSTRDERRYDEVDRRLVRKLASRAAMAIENAQLLAETRAAVRARDEFLALASHELNTPLAALAMQVWSLKRRDPEPERYAQKLDVIGRQVQRLTQLVGEMIDVSRLGEQRLRLDLDDVDLGAVVEQTAVQLAQQSARAGCPLALRLEPGVVGRWDRVRLEQLAARLISNAIKFGAGAPVEVSVESQGGIARLSVVDRGIGIEPADQARLFERFERAVSARNFGGFGLGLWMARKIVDALGGTIRVESARGEGSTFVVELPLSRDADAPSLAQHG